MNLRNTYLVQLLATQGTSIVTPYKSFSVSWHRKTSGVEMMPQCLNRPSPIERDTSRVPITRPSLRKEEEREGRKVKKLSYCFNYVELATCIYTNLVTKTELSASMCLVGKMRWKTHPSVCSQHANDW